MVIDSIILENHKSDCEKKQKKIVSRDGHNYKHIGLNETGKCVRHFQIDGKVLPKGQEPERCDFLLLTDDTIPPTAYFIELKGSLSNAKKCTNQVDTTERMCEKSLKGYRRLYRFVYGDGHGNYSSDFISWRDKKPKGSVIAKRGEIVDKF